MSWAGSLLRGAAGGEYRRGCCGVQHPRWGGGPQSLTARDHHVDVFLFREVYERVEQGTRRGRRDARRIHIRTWIEDDIDKHVLWLMHTALGAPGVLWLCAPLTNER